jgi:hypothetical protein
VIIPCLSQYFYFLVFLVGFVLMFNFLEFSWIGLKPASSSSSAQRQQQLIHRGWMRM